MVSLFGIKSCDTVRKARAWLESRGIDHSFHDMRESGLEPTLLDRWIDALGWEALLNRSSTTFRALPEQSKARLDAASAREIMLAQPTIIKRPVTEVDGQVSVGFRPELYEELFSTR